MTIKTVETHLYHAYQKLNIGGRSELPDALGESATSRESPLDAHLAAAGQPIP